MASIKHLYHISAPREKVYNEISTSEGVAKWWSIGASGENKTGAILTVPFGSFSTMKFKVKELKPNTGVTWECTEGQAEWVGNTISFLLDENEGKTRIRFEHAGWVETGDHYAACCFSWSLYLQSLRNLCQEGKGKPFST